MGVEDVGSQHRALGDEHPGHGGVLDGHSVADNDTDDIDSLAFFDESVDEAHAVYGLFSPAVLLHALFGFGAERLDVLRSGEKRVKSVGEGLDSGSDPRLE